MEKMPECIIEKEFERKRAHDVVNKIEEEGYSLDVCVWGSRAFVTITGLAMQTKNAEAMADFLDDGACEIIINIMHKYAALNETIAANCCLVVCILAWSLREMKEFLGEIGACELIVFATSMHIGDPLVSEHGSAAVGLLAKSNISNSYRLAQAGACDVMSQVGNFGFNLRHPKCSLVATHVCYAFAQLCEAQNATQLMECGASSIILELLKLHERDEVFAAAAVKALCGLASLNLKFREELGRLGACEKMVQILNMHVKLPSLTQEACEAIMHLSLSPNNTPRLADAGACQALVEALETQLMEYDFGAEVCSGAMLNLITYGVSAKENRWLLNRAGAVEQLRSAQMSTKASYRARENILQVLDILGAETVPGTASGAVKGSNGSLLPVVTLVHGSEMKGDTVPLTVEVREFIEYDSLSTLALQPSPSGSGLGLGVSDILFEGLTGTLSGAASPSNGVYEI